MMTTEYFETLDFDEKLEACLKLREYTTINSVTKSTVKHMFDWLVDAVIDKEEEEMK